MSDPNKKALRAAKKAEKARRKEEKYYLASQWQLMARKLGKHQLARFSLVILGFLYIVALFGDFLAPYNLTEYDANSKDLPPTAIHFIYEGEYIGPYVFKSEWGTLKMSVAEMSKAKKEAEARGETFSTRQIVTDETTPLKIQWFVHGSSYKILGLFESDLHLFGIEGGKVFLFGSDSLGRDLFSRIILGSQVSLTIPFAGTLISFVLGLLIGSISGYFGGMVDNVIQRIIEVLNSLPSLPLWMALSAAIPAGIPPVQMYLLITVILSLIGWTGLARVVRGKFMSLKNEDYVMAAKLAGVSDMKIIMKHMVPGFMSYLIVNLTLGIPSMIIGETSMSFLGLGIQAPATSWGVLLKEAQNVTNIVSHPWCLIPLFFVVLTVLAFNFLGDGMRDAADPYK
ncbi:MAG: ABC transporter permease [Clostridia bacterium]|nr:ABC transporter permease [Clostridia bacterium]